MGAVVGVMFAVAGAVTAEEAPPKLMSTEWLAQHLSDANLRLVDCREDIRDYWRGHIAGATWISPEALRWPDGGVPGKLMTPVALRALLRQTGLRPGNTVVIYSAASDYRATYLAWALDYLGYRRFAVLDGGFARWTAEGRPVTQDYPRVTASRRLGLPQRPDESLRATLEETQQALAARDAVVLDVRGKELYTGEKGFWKRNGHIPGALWHSWESDVTSEGTLKPVSELRAAYAALGVTPDKRVVTSCGQGQMSSHTYFVLKHVLGYAQVANYDGGFNEWSQRDDLPVATGEQPR